MPAKPAHRPGSAQVGTGHCGSHLASLQRPRRALPECSLLEMLQQTMALPPGGRCRASGHNHHITLQETCPTSGLVLPHRAAPGPSGLGSLCGTRGQLDLGFFKRKSVGLIEIHGTREGEVSGTPP